MTWDMQQSMNNVSKSVITKSFVSQVDPPTITVTKVEDELPEVITAEPEKRAVNPLSSELDELKRLKKMQEAQQSAEE